MMQKTLRRFTSLLLSLTMLLSLASTAFAADTGADTSTALAGTSVEEITSVESSASDIYDEVEIEFATLSPEECAETTYYGLSPTARDRFLAAISCNPELIEFHQQYVDSSFVPVDPPAPQVFDPVSVVSVGLAGLGVGTAVLYCLEALASEFVSAVNSGEITVGDLYSYIIAVGTISTLANDWSITGPKWLDIISVFCDAFPSISNNVTTSMEYVPADVEDECSLNTVSVGFSGTTARINGKTYKCSVRAEEFNPQGEKFYIAIRSNNILYVCPKEISLKIANAIVEFNNTYIGVMTVREYTAYRLAEFGGCIVCSDSRTNPCQPNYLHHYHRREWSMTPTKDHCRAHVWFLESV